MPILPTEFQVVTQKNCWPNRRIMIVKIWVKLQYNCISGFNKNFTFIMSQYISSMRPECNNIRFGNNK